MAPEHAVVAVFDEHWRAEETVRDLERSGFDMRMLSILGKAYRLEDHPAGFYTTGDRMRAWGGIGPFWSGLWNMLAGAAFFWMPGIGPIAAAGPIVHLLAGALEGAALVGGLSALGAALAGFGLPPHRVDKYQAELRAGKLLLVAHIRAAEIRPVLDIMKRHAATELEAVAA